MATVDLEIEYNNRLRVPTHAEFAARWAASSEAARNSLACELDIAYGPGARQRYDLFVAARRGMATPLVAFIHGGYWQRFDRKDFSFIAREILAHGIDVAVPSYTLCPEASIADIIFEMREFLRGLWQRTGRRPLVTGHSAGGHLAGAMLATDWSRIADVPDDLVRAAYSISGLFDLEPLIGTSLNEPLRLDPRSARHASPASWPPPPPIRTFIAAVGGLESSEFIRQSLDITSRWSAARVRAECVIVPGTHHFTVLEELARPDSAMLDRVVGLARAVATG